MKKEFIHYEQALALKELGFDEPCVCFQYNKDSVVRFVNMSDSKFDNLLTYHRISTNPTLIWNDTEVIIPTFSQAFRWFREKYNLNSFVIDSKSYNWYFNINNMIKDDVVSEVLYFKTYEEAELECLKKLIEIVKTDN